MARLYNLARVTTATVGTGTLALGGAVPGFLSFAAAGAADGDVLSYSIRDGTNSETGTGTYTAAGSTLTRTVRKSTNSNTAISLSGSAEVFIAPGAEDLPQSGPGAAGLTLNNLSTAQINALTGATGNLVYDSTLNVAKLYDGTGWQSLAETSKSQTFTASAVGATPITISQFSTGQTAALLALSAGDSTANSGGWLLWERPASVSFNGVPWRQIVNQNYFPGGGVGGENYANEVMAIGWNQSQTVGVPAVAGKTMVWDAWEYKFNGIPGGGYQSERHMQMVDVTGRTSRFNTYGAPANGGGAGNTGFSNQLSVDKFLLATGGPNLTVTGAVNNGGGLIRLSVATGQAAGWITGQRKNVASVGGVPNATGDWVITVVDNQTIDLQNSTWGGLFTSGGTISNATLWQIDTNLQIITLVGAPLFKASTNNVPFFQQNNAAGNANLNLPYINANNEILNTSPVTIQSTRNANPLLGANGAILQIQQLSANNGDYLIYSTLTTVTGSQFAYSFNGAMSTGLTAELNNSDTTHGTANCTYLARVGGASAGDPRIQFQVDSVQDWTVGIDNDVSQGFAIAAGTALGTTNALTFTTGLLGTFGGGVVLAAGTTSVAPLQMVSGTNLTSVVAGAEEFDGVQKYFTIDTTSGRGAIPVEQYFHLTSDGGSISTIGNFFGTTSNISLVASAHYDIEIVLFFAKSTGGTVTWTLTNSSAPTSQNIYYEMSPVAGEVPPPGTATMLVGQFTKDATAVRTVVTGTLVDSTDYYARFRIWLQNGTGTNLKIQATASAGSLTPRNGSWWYCKRRSPNNIGTFAA